MSGGQRSNGKSVHNKLTFSFIDIIECLSNPCHQNATCTNTPGSFTCVCDSNFYGNGFICSGESNFLVSSVSIGYNCVSL